MGYLCEIVTNGCALTGYDQEIFASSEEEAREKYIIWLAECGLIEDFDSHHPGWEIKISKLPPAKCLLAAFERLEAEVVRNSDDYPRLQFDLWGVLPEDLREALKARIQARKLENERVREAWEAWKRGN